uniref:Chromosome 11 open reading frame 65 n=1 Tax=Leptobrachium leishanense TaxID=445787 RepID=A0A8C5MEB2_9ANUR
MITGDVSEAAPIAPDLYSVERERAATSIQRAFRRVLDLKVFQFYKNLINFKGMGDPRLLLKSINPREAELIDAAAGVHVRFRLGGVTFPPNIYYKLFTHRPIVDMCANSPKDYTRQSVKQPLPRQIHNRGTTPVLDHDNWYRRVENNGWRPLALRVFDDNDHITADKYKKITFPHLTLRRRQDVEKRQKQRKIDWMRKMYYQGSLYAQMTDQDTVILVQKATQGVIHSIEQHGTDSVMDWEVDELLHWTNALNYEEYVGTWKAIGTSKSSSAFTGSAFSRSLYDLHQFSHISIIDPASTTSRRNEDEPQPASSQ